MNLLDGKLVSAEVRSTMRLRVQEMLAAGLRAPCLAAVLVGDNPASQTYVQNKILACHDTGFQSELIQLPGSTSEEELLRLIDDLNASERIDGFIVQLPLPEHIRVSKVTERINPLKDVDGFHPINTGRMSLQLPCHVPATPKGILMLLEYYGIKTSGKHCVVLGRSHIVGTPVSILMSRNSEPGNCTVTVCHSRTPDVEKYTREADILIAAVGQAGLVHAGMIKEGAVVIDVGMNRIQDLSRKSGFRLVGDVLFDEVAPLCSYITPVPGGVGPMTIAGLLSNTLAAATNEIEY